MLADWSPGANEPVVLAQAKCFGIYVLEWMQFGADTPKPLLDH